MSDWIEWHGGKCPVDEDTQVLVRLRGGYAATDPHAAGVYTWCWPASPSSDWGDIVAYRLVDAPAATALSEQPHGSHYKDCPIQPVQFIEANSLQFLEGCIVKRAARHDKPTGKGREDIEKIIHEARLLLELRYGGEVAA